MSYQVLARKWRPQRFSDVLGQDAVTRTLRNALKVGRLSQAFVFAGPRGCGKTTTARLLARALNCVQGPTPEPCGVCDGCIEIAQGRDIDVLEIDAATHTGVDNVREVIIEGLSISPVRDRYKVFIIDEVHMLSSSSFNALLKSIEEPPPHVVFIMATTELRKIPDTVLSRTQVHEFRTISSKIVAERLKFIAAEEQIDVPDAALLLLARAGEGSMRDSLTAFDQVRAFAGDRMIVDDVVAVLGLVGRDLVLDMLEATVVEDAAAAFMLVERAIERGYDLRILCRELARATRDLLLLSVDPARANDQELAAEGERDRLQSLVGRSSREDLLRGFDLLTRAEEEIRLSEQPRYNLEMTLVRLMHMRKLVPIADLIVAADSAPRSGRTTEVTHSTRAVASASAPATPRRLPSAPTSANVAREAASAPPPADKAPGNSPPSLPAADAVLVSAGPGHLKDAFLAEVKTTKVFFYNTVVAAAYRVEATPDRIIFSFLPNQKVPRQQCEDARAWLEGLSEKMTGHRIPVTVLVEASPAPAVTAPAPEPALSPEEALRNEALADPTVQALFEIFPVERTRVEEM